LIAKRENLIKPMISGQKLWHQPLDSSWGNPAVALIIAAVTALVAYVMIY
jgi:hypothetical protein